MLVICTIYVTLATCTDLVHMEIPVICIILAHMHYISTFLLTIDPICTNIAHVVHLESVFAPQLHQMRYVSAYGLLTIETICANVAHMVH